MTQNPKKYHVRVDGAIGTLDQVTSFKDLQALVMELMDLVENIDSLISPNVNAQGAVHGIRGLIADWRK